MPSPFRRVKALSRAHARACARLRLSSFLFFAFTASLTLRKPLTDCTIRVKTLGENRDFSSKIGESSADNALILNRFAFTSEKNHIHTPFRGVEIGERAPYAREYAESTKDHTHIFLFFSYLISTNVYLTRHAALRFFSAFASAFSPRRAAQNTSAEASKGCEGKNAKVFTPNAQ